MLDEVKEHLRIDGSEDDTFLTSLIEAAKLYIKNGTGYPVNETNNLHKLAIKLLVGHWYENREVAVVGRISTDIQFSLESILMQMKYIPPITPTGFIAEVEDGTVYLSWDANSEYTLEGYKVYQDGSEIATLSDTEYEVSGLSEGEYSFRVSAYDEDDNESRLTDPITVTI